MLSEFRIWRVLHMSFRNLVGGVGPIVELSVLFRITLGLR